MSHPSLSLSLSTRRHISVLNNKLIITCFDISFQKIPFFLSIFSFYIRFPHVKYILCPIYISTNVASCIHDAFESREREKITVASKAKWKYRSISYDVLFTPFMNRHLFIFMHFSIFHMRFQIWWQFCFSFCFSLYSRIHHKCTHLNTVQRVIEQNNKFSFCDLYFFYIFFLQFFFCFLSVFALNRFAAFFCIFFSYIFFV